MFLIEKKTSSAISNEEFKLFKNTWDGIHNHSFLQYIIFILKYYNSFFINTTSKISFH
jgi:hypothetical protein